MTTPRNEKPNSSFFLLNVRAQASRVLSLGCALLMPNTIWRVTTRIWLIWLIEAIFRRGTNQRVLLRSTKENAVYSSRRGYQCRSAATEHVEALSARFFTFLWLVTYLCSFHRHFEFHLWGNAHARIHCRVINCFSKAKCDEDQACARGYQRLLKTGPTSEENLNSKFNLS